MIARTLETTLTVLAVLFLGSVALFMIYMLVIFAPVSMVAEAHCLERGYPNSRVTWNLKRYCTNLEGTVTVRVDSLDGEAK